MSQADSPLPPPMRRGRGWERFVEAVLALAALSSIAVTLGIVGLLFYNAIGFLTEVPITDFLFGTEWTPGHADQSFGVLPLVAGTVIISGIALLVAVPVGTIVAIYLSEYAPDSLREVLKPVLELLSAVPTVVYGFFAYLIVTPILALLMPDIPNRNMLSAGLVMGLMILPYVSSLSEDALRSVPSELREGSAALGATKLQTSLKVLFPAAFSGITSAYVLAISRALGETMIVNIAAGTSTRLVLDPTASSYTMTSAIVKIYKSDLDVGSVEFKSLYAIGLLLFLSTLIFNVLSYLLRKRFREAY